MRTPLGQIWKPRFDRTPSGGGLVDRIVRMMLDAVRAQVCPPGSPLPSSRELARELGVSRNTVVAALDRLVEQGVVLTRPRSGYQVSPHAPDSVLDIEDPTEGLANLPAPDWPARLAIRPAEQRNIAKPTDWHRFRYPFVYGQVDATLFPHPEWRDCSERALRGQDSREMLSDRIDRDDPLLLEQIRTRLLPRRGVWARDAEILVTNGAQHALFLLAQLLVRPGEAVGIEDPGYPDARNIFALHQAHLRPIPVDEGGLTIGQRLRGCRTVYLTPSHQCPTTVTMPLQRRHQLLAFAARHDIALIEDDYEPETRYDGQPTPALKSLDLAGRVVYVGSLSKTLAPGIRLGYVVADAGLITQLRALRRLMLRHPASHNQRALALFLAEGHYDTLSRRMQLAFKARARALVGALARHLPAWRADAPAGGSALWLQLPGGLDADLLAQAARDEGVIVEAGGVFHANERRGRNTLRIGFSSIPVELIEPGVAALAAVAARHMRP